ncbi:MAG: S-layer homology domain-containing protein, partial [Oscillospiraceae bacterium]|nr:S-layer homology domain-containing protein [Oscillospiraceae bacterium]
MKDSRLKISITKRVLPILLVVMMVFGLFPLSASADAPKAVLAPSAASVSLNADFTVALSVTEGGAYVGLQAVVTYDATRVEYKSASPTTADGILVDVYEETLGTLLITVNGSASIADSATALTLTLTAKAAGTANFSASDVEIAPVTRGSAVSATDANASVTVESALTPSAGDPWVDADLVIYTVEELLAFAESVSGGNTYADEVVRLGANIDLSGVPEFPGIGSYSAGIAADRKPFSGVFDGDGYTVNLAINTPSRFGLFGYIKDAVVKNLVTTGSVTYTGSNSFNGVGVAAVVYISLNSVIENCVNRADVTALGYTGSTGVGAAGIVGRSVYGDEVSQNPVGSSYTYQDTLVKNCINYGTIRSSSGAAGIAYSANHIVQCGNEGNIFGDAAGANTQGSVGGIVAVSSANDTALTYIYSVYNTGTVTAEPAYTTSVGGIVGAVNRITIKNSYNIGGVYQNGHSIHVGGSSPANAAGIIGVTLTGVNSVWNSYSAGTIYAAPVEDRTTPTIVSPIGNGPVLENCYDARTTLPASPTAAELNQNGDSEFIDGTNGFPILKWQTAVDAYLVTFMSADNAVVTITGRQGSGTQFVLPTGTYSYTATNGASGTFNVTSGPKTIALSAEVTFLDLPNGATLTVKSTESGASDQTVSDGIITLPNGTYEFTATLGLESVSGEFIVVGVDRDVTVPRIAAMVDVTFAVTPPTATIAVKDSDGGAVTAKADGKTFSLYVGETYDYTVSLPNYVQQSGSLTVDAAEIIPITLLRITVDVAFNVTPSDAAFELKDGSNQAVTPVSGNTYRLNVGDTYTYSASKNGYETLQSVSYLASASATAVSVTLRQHATVTIAVTPTNASLTVTSSGDIVAADSSDTTTGVHTYTLYVGQPYSYTVSATDYNSETHGFTAADGQQLSVTLSPSTFGTGTMIWGNENAGKQNTITTGGVYDIAPEAKGVITINTTQPVTLVGRGVAQSNMYTDVKIVSTAGVNLTLSNVYILNNGTKPFNALDFTGDDNVLTISGTNLLEMEGFQGNAVPALVHVPSTASLLVNGSGTLYFYKQGGGAGFGGNIAESNGAITFDCAKIFGKGTHQGAVIGTGSGATTPGPITIKSGEINIISNARGALIGGGASSTGGTSGGNVYIEGGTITLNVDYSGAAIGGGGYNLGNDANGGKVYISGSSLRTFIDYNATDEDGNGDHTDTMWSGVTEAGVNDTAITAEKVDGGGTASVYLLTFNTELLSADADTFTVKTDGGNTPIYSGGLHRYKYINEQLPKLSQIAISYTVDNWVALDDPNLYLYLTGENHALDVNGEAFTATWNATTETFTVASAASEVIKVESAQTVGDATTATIDGDELSGTGDIELAIPVPLNADRQNTFEVTFINHALQTISTSGRKVRLETALGTLTFDAAALAKLAQLAGTYDLVIEIKDISPNHDRTLFEITATAHGVPIYTDGNGGGTVTIALPYTRSNTDLNVVLEVWYLVNGVRVTNMNASFANNQAVFPTSHLSQYEIVENASEVGLKAAPTVSGKTAAAVITGTKVSTAPVTVDARSSLGSAAEQVTVTLERDALAALIAKPSELTIRTDIGTFKFPVSSLTTLKNANSGNVNLAFSKVVDDNTHRYTFNATVPFTVSVPFSTTSNEVRVYRVTGTSRTELSSTGFTYNNGIVTFSTNGATVFEIEQGGTGDPYATVWDGRSIDITWFNPSASTYHIKTPAQLAGLAALVNGLYNDEIDTIVGNTAYIQVLNGYGTESGEGYNMSTPSYHYGAYNFAGKTVYIDNDIDMGTANYMPIGGQYLMTPFDATTRIDASFNGVFDGQGHTITINTNRWAGTAMYGDGSSVGLIGRLGVHDNDAASLRRANIGVRNVIVEGSVYANRSVGGVVGKVGKNNGGAFITNCANYATVTGTDAKGTGGIVGAGWIGVTISSCYNAGRITNNYGAVAGISGSNEGRIENCYNYGKITTRATLQSAAIASNNGGGSYVNCYWLTGSADIGVYGNPQLGDGAELTSSYMKSSDFAAQMGSAFTRDNGVTLYNYGYPILAVGQYTIPRGDSGSATITPPATVSGGTANASVTTTEVTTAVNAAQAGNIGAVTIIPQFSGNANAVAVTIPKTSVNAIKNANLELIIETSVGDLTFNAAALSAIAAAASGNDIKITIQNVDKATLTAAQKESVGDRPLLEVVITSGGTVITNLGSGKLTISAPYTLKTDEKASGVVVYTLGSDGKLTAITGRYSNGTVEFTVSSLDKFVIGYDADAAWDNPYIDVREGDWFYDAVKYVTQNDLMNGVGNSRFAPNANLTRAMLATVLYRLEGEPTITGANPFSDVAAGQWYTNAVIWAERHGIVEGYGNGKFGPEDNITREQLVTMLWRYAKYKGYDLTINNEQLTINNFADADTVSDYAKDAMRWAVAVGLIQGRTTTTIVPRGTATRAEVAAI